MSPCSCSYPAVFSARFAVVPDSGKGGIASKLEAKRKEIEKLEAQLAQKEKVCGNKRRFGCLKAEAWGGFGDWLREINKTLKHMHCLMSAQPPGCLHNNVPALFVAGTECHSSWQRLRRTGRTHPVPLTTSTSSRRASPVLCL